MIHDDLPCMDDDILTRNAYLLKVYGEDKHPGRGTTFNYAFEILANAPHLQPNQKLVSSTSFQTSGATGWSEASGRPLYEGKK